MTVPHPLDEFFREDKSRPKTATSFVTDALRRGILTGTIGGGTQLKQDELADKFGVSRMPIRDALKQLEAEGLVTHIPHKGVTVSLMTVDDIVELFDMRIMAEREALRIGFKTITPEKLKEMDCLCLKMESIEDPSVLSMSNRRFHWLLYEQINRPRLLSLISSLYDASDRYLRVLLVSLEYNRNSQNDHRRFYDACRAGDLQAAQDALTNHLINGRNEVVAFLRQQRLGLVTA